MDYYTHALYVNEDVFSAQTQTSGSAITSVPLNLDTSGYSVNPEHPKKFFTHNFVALHKAELFYSIIRAPDKRILFPWVTHFAAQLVFLNFYMRRRHFKLNHKFLNCFYTQLHFCLYPWKQELCRNVLPMSYKPIWQSPLSERSFERNR